MAIRVLVVDDSAFMRKLIAEIINEQEDMEAKATARHGEDALKKIDSMDFDIVTLDVEMPVMDGIQTLAAIMRRRPLPVIMLSSLTKKSSDITLKALSLGAIDFILKPSGSISLHLETVAAEITEKIRAGYNAKIRRPQSADADPRVATAMPVITRAKHTPRAPARGMSGRVVVIGASTGGPRAVEEVFLSLPDHLPACVLVTQHMPKGFTRSFAERLNGLSPLYVKEAEDGDSIADGRAYIAPGDYHMLARTDRRLHLNQAPPVQFLRPSVDVTMESLPPIYGSQVVGVILTGMGRDGAKGMAAIKAAGGRTIAQDKSTSTIYSMPRVVFEEGSADYVLPVNRIGESIGKLIHTMVGRE